MKNKILKRLYLLLIGVLSACSGHYENKINIYVTPLYDSNTRQINVGKYSERLQSNSAQKMLILADEIKNCIDEVNIETLYVLAIRLYDLNKKDEAAYWFYTAQSRRRILYKMAIDMDITGIPAFLNAFNDLSGKWINGYIGGFHEKWIEILENVIKDTENMGYIAKAYPDYSFKPEEEQQAIVDEDIAELRKIIEYLNANKDELLRKRKENGVEGKY